MEQAKPVYWIQQLEIARLWGEVDRVVKFNKDVTILIGPNGSGKTTILNVIYHVVSVNIEALSSIQFDEIVIRLSQFDQPKERTITVHPLADGYEYWIDDQVFIARTEDSPLFRLGIRRPKPDPNRELQDLLRSELPIAWLSVSRRIPVGGELEEERLQRSGSLRPESVDHRLSYLLDNLMQYRLRLDARLAQLYKDFERNVLLEMLYNPDQDRLVKLGGFPTEDEKQRLIEAFRAINLLDDRVEEQIETHFSAAEEAMAKLQKRADEKDFTTPIPIDDVFVLPLIRRTHAMVEHAQVLDLRRDHIFEPLDRYEYAVNQFFTSKNFMVLDDGTTWISPIVGDDSGRIEPHQLSSGEKQLLILLTEAFLREDAPGVYIADEPELSLHVEWQAKLLETLRHISSNLQIIVATHSPDIVGPFTSHIIELRPVEI